MQGFNMGRYYPPDTENAPTFNTSHPLGRRANKISQGILTVRFELPFAVWCDTCKPTALIGQGVRFNAEKKKVGNYYSTPVWQFRMKHSACGGWWEIRTDPKNAEYVVVEGAKRRDYGDGEKGDLQEGDLKFLTEEEREKRREDAFANLEGKLEDKGNEKKTRERVEELYDAAEVWRDPYDVNAKLRRDFRQKRKVWQKDDRKKESMQNKFSLGIEIADEIDTDRVKAGLIEFGGGGTNDQRVEEASRKPLFASNEIKQIEDGEKKSGKLKSEILAAKSRQNLQQTLVGNTRATIDPFLSRNGTVAPKMNFGILKRKRGNESHPSSDTLTIEDTPRSIPPGGEAPAKKPVLSTALVDYDSD